MKIYKSNPEDFEKVSHETKKKYIKTHKSVSYWQDAWRKLKANKIAMLAFFVIILLFLFAFFGPTFVPYKYDQQIRKSESLFPFEYSQQELLEISQGKKVFAHVFGTDEHGRDIFVRLMYGTRVSLSIGIIGSVLILIIGTLYGALSGFIGGLLDNIMMRIAEIISSIPDVLIVLLMSVTIKPVLANYANNHIHDITGKLIIALGSGVISIFITFALLYWVTMARIIRSQIMQLKNQEFILAARALGASNLRIIRKHLIPNCIGVMIATTCLEIPSAIFLESFLSFLGLGVSAPMTSLGSMSADALGGIYSYTYRLILPAFLLSIMILAFNLFGDGLRDALDPKIK